MDRTFSQSPALYTKKYIWKHKRCFDLPLVHRNCLIPCKESSYATALACKTARSMYGPCMDRVHRHRPWTLRRKPRHSCCGDARLREMQTAPTWQKAIVIKRRVPADKDRARTALVELIRNSTSHIPARLLQWLNICVHVWQCVNLISVRMCDSTSA